MARARDRPREIAPPEVFAGGRFQTRAQVYDRLPFLDARHAIGERRKHVAVRVARIDRVEEHGTEESRERIEEVVRIDPRRGPWDAHLELAADGHAPHRVGAAARSRSEKSGEKLPAPHRTTQSSPRVASTMGAGPSPSGEQAAIASMPLGTGSL